METIRSFKGYGKVDRQQQEQAFRKKSRKRVVILFFSIIVLVALIAGVIAGVVHKRNSDNNSPSSSTTSPAASLKAICGVTQYPDSCLSSIQSLEASNVTADPNQLFKLSLLVVLNELSRIASFPQTLAAKTNDLQLKAALRVCQTVITDAVDRLNDTVSSTEANNGEKIPLRSQIEDLKTWLSAAITDQETCFDALQEVPNTAAVINEAQGIMKNSTEFASNSLAIVVKVLGVLGNFNIPIHRKLLWGSDSGFPEWVRAGDRRLLQVANPTPNVTVAKDGSGNYTTIMDAVAKVPKKSTSTFVIYIKAGVYLETVTVGKNAWNVMMYGDGMNATVVSGSLNNADGIPTFQSATFTVTGPGFMARDMGFQNSAGAAKHQAVAMRTASDRSVYYRCLFDGFQDTLYSYSNRQFYRECTITGTIDFIFGNAAAVYQSCYLQPRQPLANQFNTVTAQGKSDPNQNTGFVIQNSVISPLDSITVQTYLGRPWHTYSTTVVMGTSIASFLNPQGWYPWVYNVTPADTIFYAEYQNTGPGSSVANRVTWPGYYPSITANQASKYTVPNFINGEDWLQATGVTFDTSL